MDTGEPTGAAVAAGGRSGRCCCGRSPRRRLRLRGLRGKAAAGDLRAAEAARDMAWEQLHSGPWGEVEPAWRHAYALASTSRALASVMTAAWRSERST
ncbi:hypothetical protein ZWY2020_014130 [Hordeum vulgare]|nr:hypothetical protein ZWY2020_014130 [Hordeum vulgare]